MEFTCKACGSTQLNVWCEFKVLNGAMVESWWEYGPLMDSHHIGDITEDECIDSWEASPHELEEEGDRFDREFYVRCAGCRREIPFGWSHPNYGGRIWPVECDDFNTGGTAWMDPKYAED